MRRSPGLRAASLACAGVTLCVANAVATPNGGAADLPFQQRPGDKEIKLAEQDEAFLKRANAAVQRGKAWLLKRAGKDGRWTTIHDTQAGHGPYLYGGTALALLALLESDANRHEDAIKAGFKTLQEGWSDFQKRGRQPGKGAWKTYEAGLTLMALDALDRWNPVAKPGKTAAAGILKKAELEWAKQLRDFLLANQAPTREVVESNVLQRKKEAWHYPSTEKNATDHSNTQYAVLGLRSASALGHPSPPETWQRVIDNFLALQETSGPSVPRLELKRQRRPKKGESAPVSITRSRFTDRARGWAYPGGTAPKPGGAEYECATGSMTTVGLACLAIAWDELYLHRRGDRKRKLRPNKDVAKWMQKTQAAVDKAKWDGFAWLAHHWSVTENPKSGHWHYYYLYGLERAGVLWKLPTIGEHDWYRLGGELLCDAQRDDGSWDDQNDDHVVVSTCFALLFLQRATMPTTSGTGG